MGIIIIHPINLIPFISSLQLPFPSYYINCPFPQILSLEPHSHLHIKTAKIL